MRNAIILLLILSAACSSTTPVNNQNAAVAETPAAVVITDERALKLLKIKDSVAPFFKPMGEPDKYDWLAKFPEAGQTFEQYVTGTPTLPTPERRIIYIQPAGEFKPTESKVLKLTADYMEAFFGLPVKTLPTISLNSVPADKKRKHPSEGTQQILTGYFIDELLPKILPKDAAAFVCLTNRDLYPRDEWSFVFGQANLQTRVGVYSFARFGDPNKSARSYDLFLGRTLSTAMHETGHMFSIQHCTKYECLISGSNHLGESDRRPLDMCPECALKIAWGFDYEPAKRYSKLAAFWRREKRPDLADEFEAKARAVTEAAK